MVFKKKPVAKIHIELGEDSVVRSNVSGDTHSLADMLCCTLAAHVIEIRKEQASRGELRDMLLGAIGAHFDDQWKMQMLEGQNDEQH